MDNDLHVLCDICGLNDAEYSDIFRQTNKKKGGSNRGEFDGIVRDLFESIGLTYRQCRYLPDPVETNVQFERLSDGERKLLLRTTSNVVNELIGRIYPADPIGLREAFWGTNDSGHLLTRSRKHAKRHLGKVHNKER